MVVVLHGTDSVVTEYVDLWEPPRTDNAYAGSAFREVVSAHRDVSDCIASLICHGTLSRFPRLKIASVENGADWVAPLLRGLKLVHGRIPQDFAEDPVEVFRRNVWVTPFWETDIVELIGLIGAGKVLFGSDYPPPRVHPRAAAVPRRTGRGWTTPRSARSWAATPAACWACGSKVFRLLAILGRLPSGFVSAQPTRRSRARSAPYPHAETNLEGRLPPSGHGTSLK